MDFSKARWRKATDVNREYAIFELMDDDVILLHVGFSDQKVFEIAFHEGISSAAIVSFDDFLRMIEDGRKLAEADM